MLPILDLFYLAAFGGAIVAALLCGVVWVAVRLMKIPAGRTRLNLYRGAIVASPFLPVIAYLLIRQG